jgi:hypothetical protein
MVAVSGNGGSVQWDSYGRLAGSQLNLDFWEAVDGSEKTISIHPHVECPTCSGTGAKPGTKPTSCNQESCPPPPPPLLLLLLPPSPCLVAPPFRRRATGTADQSVSLEFSAD